MKIKTTPKTTPPLNTTGSRYKQFNSIRSVLLRGGLSLIMTAIVSSLIPANDHYAIFWALSIPLVVMVIVQLLYIRYPGRWNAAKFRARIVAWYENLEIFQRLYLTVIGLMLVVGYCYLLSPTELFPAMTRGLVLYCYGVATYDVLRIYQWLSNTLLGKGLIAIGIAIGSNLAFSISGILISSVAHVAASNFAHTLSFVAIASIPVLLIGVGAIFLPITILVAPLIWILSELQTSSPWLMKLLFTKNIIGPTRRHLFATLLFQVFLYSFLAAMTPRFVIYFVNENEQKIESSIKQMIFQFDMYPGTECKVGPHYRTAALGDENYLLASRTSSGTVLFEKPRKCPLAEP